LLFLWIGFSQNFVGQVMHRQLMSLSVFQMGFHLGWVHTAVHGRGDGLFCVADDGEW
jgi:hypothetical protein